MMMEILQFMKDHLPKRLKKMIVKIKKFSRIISSNPPIRNNFFVITEDRVAGGTCKVAQDFKK